MDDFTEPSSSVFAVLLRAVGNFIFGAAIGFFPALWLCTLTSDSDIRWKMGMAVVGLFGCSFAVLAVLTRGRFFAWLLRFLGKEVDPGSY